MPLDVRFHTGNKGLAYVEYSESDDATKALKHMDGGQIDGQEIVVQFTLAAMSGDRGGSPPRRPILAAGGYRRRSPLPPQSDLNSRYRGGPPRGRSPPRRMPPPMRRSRSPQRRRRSRSRS